MLSRLHGADRYQRWTWFFVALTAVGCVTGIVVPAGLGWDFANFYDAGRRVAAGQVADLYNPISAISGQPPLGLTGFFGTPLSAVFYVPLAAFPATTALILFKIENVIALAATGILLLRVYRPFVAQDAPTQARFTALFALLFLIFQPFWTIFRVGGQTTPTVLLLVTIGLIAHVSDRFWTSAITVTLAVLIKPALAPLLLFVAGVSGLVYLRRMTTVLALAGVLSLLVMGWPAHAAFLDLMARSNQLVYPWYYNSSLYVPLNTLRQYPGVGLNEGMLGALSSGLILALKCLVVFTVIRLWLRSRREVWTTAARHHFDFSLGVLLFLLWSSTAWEHYLSLLFPWLIYLVASRTHFRRAALTLVALIVVLCLGQNLIFITWLRHQPLLGSLPALMAISLLKSGPLWLTLMLLWRHPADLLRSHADPTWAKPRPFHIWQGTR